MKKILLFSGIFVLLIIIGCTKTEVIVDSVCTKESKICPDGSAVERTGPNCEFAKCSNSTAKPQNNIINKCGEKRPEICTMDYNPVCGYFNTSIQCFKYPCGATYGNACGACSDPKVAYWEKGECPK